MALGQILAHSLTRNDHFMKPVARPALSRPTLGRSSGSLSSSLNRLISAAVVSPHFRCLLFSDPVAALAMGYNGETFQLSPAEYAAVTSLNVNSVREFAAQLLFVLQGAKTEVAPYETAPRTWWHRTETAAQSPDTSGD